MQLQEKPPYTSTQLWLWILGTGLVVVLVSMIVDFTLQGLAGINRDVSHGIAKSIQYFLLGVVFLGGGMKWIKLETRIKRLALLLLCLGFWSQPLLHFIFLYLRFGEQIASTAATMISWVFVFSVGFWIASKLQQQ